MDELLGWLKEYNILLGIVATGIVSAYTMGRLIQKGINKFDRLADEVKSGFGHTRKSQRYLARGLLSNWRITRRNQNELSRLKGECAAHHGRGGITTSDESEDDVGDDPEIHRLTKYLEEEENGGD